MGMFDLLQGPYSQNPVTPGIQKQRIVPAHVLEVCIDKGSPLYENPADIGKIKYRDVGNLTPFKTKVEDEVIAVAWPMDRSVGRYPLPGEQVIVFEAFGDVLLPNATTLQRIAFYAFNVNTNHNITSNQTPFILSNSANTSKKPVSSVVASKRFTNKLKEPKEFRDNGDVKIYPQVQPFEGDFILQGRFGNSIRLGSSANTVEGRRDKGNETLPWTSHGVPGDPIMILRVNSEYVTDTEDMYVVEDPSKDQGSVYLCSTQNIELKLQIPKRMKTWEETYLVSPRSDKKEDQITSTSKLYEDLYSKVVEMDKDVHEQLAPHGDDAVDRSNAATQAIQDEGVIESQVEGIVEEDNLATQ
jgi:hypothetical protein